MHAMTLAMLRDMLKHQAWSFRNELYRQIVELEDAGLDTKKDEKLLRAIEEWMSDRKPVEGGEGNGAETVYHQ